MADHQLQALSGAFQTIEIADEQGTRRLANDIAMVLKPGDVICLSGDLGAGKSTFTRALIRTFAGEPELEVPSPTFTLVQTYDFPRFDLSHFDLYRLEEPEELEELGLEDLLETGAALIEWPEKANELLPGNALWIQITQPTDDDDHRRFSLYSDAPHWQNRIGQSLATRFFLGTAGLPDAERCFLAGDASLRTFETVATGSSTAVLMRWPFQGDAVPEAVRAYMEKVHLARDCRAIVAVGTELRNHGLARPILWRATWKTG